MTGFLRPARPAAPAFALGVLLLSAAPESARADLRVCNGTDAVTSVAVGYSDDGTWVSEGWWTMRPGDCKTMLPGDLKNRYYYWRATQDGAPLPTGDYYFCTSPKVFTIRGDTDCESRGYDRVSFSQVDTGDARTYTINVTGGAAPAPAPAPDDGLADIRRNLQGDWYATQAPQFMAFVSGRELTLVNDGEQLDTLGFDVAQTCDAAEGDGPVLLIDPPAPNLPPDCWLLVETSRDSWEIYIYETGEGAAFRRQN